MDFSNTFSDPVVGSAFGGFLGIGVLFLFRCFWVFLASRPKIIKVYLCCTNQNHGQNSEFRGEIMHHFGTSVVGENTLKALGAKYSIWEYTANGCGTLHDRNSILYGPYSTDFTIPGVYSVQLKLRTHGFSKVMDSHNLVLLMFSIIKCSEPFIEDSYTNSSVVARSFVRINDVFESKWHFVNLIFYAPLGYIWDYRVNAFNGINNLPHNIPEGIKIYFDSISIKHLKSFQLPNY